VSGTEYTAYGNRAAVRCDFSGRGRSVGKKIADAGVVPEQALAVVLFLPRCEFEPTHDFAEVDAGMCLDFRSDPRSCVRALWWVSSWAARGSATGDRWA